MKTPVLRIGMLGAARIGYMGIVKPSREISGVELAALAARDRARATQYARKYGIGKVHDSYQSLIDDPDIDAIYNPLPNALHCEWTIRALAAGKHVLCEKPIASNASEARAMAQAAREHDRVLMEAFHYRYHPLAQRMVEAVGQLGKIHHIEARMCFPLPLRGDIRYNFALAGGATMDVGAYTANIVRLLAAASGEPALAAAPEVVSARAKLFDANVDRAMSVRLRWADGTTGRIENSLWSARVLSFSARVRGERGELRVTNPIAPHFYNRLVLEVDGKRCRERVAGKATYTYQLEAFADRICRGAPYADELADAIANMALIDAIYDKAGLPRRGRVSERSAVAATP